MDRAVFDDELKSALKKMSLTPNDEQTAQFARYLELLLEWNEKINLTSVTAQKDVIRRHFADSLSPMALLPDGGSMFGNASVIDVGTGAGFPGIPLKIMNPDMRLTLLDSKNKRVKFLEEVIEELSLTGVKTICARAEDAGHDDNCRGKYDICVSRAVANMATLSEYCLPFLKKGGEFIAYRAADTDEELEMAQRAITLTGGEVKNVYVFDTPDGVRSLAVIKKIKETPEKYPRRPGKPAKDPL